MFLIFTTAALIVTGAVWALAAVGGWWMLGVAVAVHVAMTAVVALEVLHVIDGRTFAIPHRSRTSHARTGTLTAGHRPTAKPQPPHSTTPPGPAGRMPPRELCPRLAASLG
jgi:hypothetical protein